jgi:hypothetical protein
MRLDGPQMVQSRSACRLTSLARLNTLVAVTSSCKSRANGLQASEHELGSLLENKILTGKYLGCLPETKKRPNGVMDDDMWATRIDGGRLPDARKIVCIVNVRLCDT